MSNISINNAIPENALERQLYFIEKCKEHVAQLKKELNRPLLCCTQTFGCQMNARDSEKLLGILEEIGYTPTDSEEADIVVYNTCTVRENANLRVYGRLGQLSKIKEKNPHMVIALCGCMMQEPDVVEKIRKSYKFVDVIFGTFNIFKIAELLYTHWQQAGQIIDIWDSTKDVVEELPTQRKFPFKSGVNIMYGCNNFCTYCIVPYVRGRERSRSIENIVDEVRQAVAKGYKEFTLLGQNVNSYGKDFAVKDQFAKLLRRVNEIPGVERIRYMTSHPRDMHEDVIKAVAECEHICENFHIPFQSGSNKILKAMNRGYTREKYLELVAMIRRYVPEAAITTDIIVGFPGETEADFNDTLNLVKEVGFDAAFTFIYSKRSGTPAAAMEEQVPLEIKKARLNLLMEAQNISSLQRNEAMVGKTLEVLAEGPSNNNNKVWSGRTRTNKLVLWPVEGRDFELGDKVQVQIETAQTWLLKGKAVE